jgi:hypothetical protein
VPVPDWSKPIILGLVLLALAFAIRSWLAARRAGRLERQRVTLLRDMSAMQATLVPEVPAKLGGLAISVAYQPADGPAAGGDFYDLFAPEPGKVAIILGDVSGHGRNALAHAALARYTLRAYLQAGLEPRAALALAGEVLTDPEIEHYATVAVGIYDSREGQLVYALAGHPPPIMRGTRSREPLTLCSSPPIGWGFPTGRRQSIVSLPTGAEVCFFSDGLVEARAEEGLVGRARLEGMVDELGRKATAKDLLAQVRDLATETPDDMAACVLRVESGCGERAVHVEELEVDARALEGDSVEHFLEACGLPAQETARTIDSAASITATGRTALMRMALEPHGPMATVEPTSIELSHSVLRDRPPVSAALQTRP